MAKKKRRKKIESHIVSRYSELVVFIAKYRWIRVFTVYQNTGIGTWYIIYTAGNPNLRYYNDDKVHRWSPQFEHTYIFDQSKCTSAVHVIYVGVCTGI